MAEPTSNDNNPARNRLVVFIKRLSAAAICTALATPALAGRCPPRPQHPTVQQELGQSCMQLDFHEWESWVFLCVFASIFVLILVGAVWQKNHPDKAKSNRAGERPARPWQLRDEDFR